MWSVRLWSVHVEYVVSQFNAYSPMFNHRQVQPQGKGMASLMGSQASRRNASRGFDTLSFVSVSSFQC